MHLWARSHSICPSLPVYFLTLLCGVCIKSVPHRQTDGRTDGRINPEQNWPPWGLHFRWHCCRSIWAEVCRTRRRPSGPRSGWRNRSGAEIRQKIASENCVRKLHNKVVSETCVRKLRKEIAKSYGTWEITIWRLALRAPLKRTYSLLS